MKFGRQLSELVDPKFRNYCVAYNMLKGFIAETDSKRGRIQQTIQDVTSAAVPFLPQAPAEQLPSVRFQEALNSELEKINRFCELEEDTLLTDLKAVIRRIRSMDGMPGGRLSQVEQVRVELDRIATEICAFSSFIDLNHTAFRKITKKESKVHKTSSSAWFMANVARAPCMTVDFEKLVTCLAVCYELVRSPQSAMDCTPTARGPSKSARILSAWVSNEDLLQVKVALAKAMSLEVSSSRQVLLESILLGSRQAAIMGSKPISATYYDTPWLDSYKEQVTGALGLQVELDGESALVSLPSGLQLSLGKSSWESEISKIPQVQSLLNSGSVPLVDCVCRRWVFHSADLEVRLEQDAGFSMHANGEKLEAADDSIFAGHILYVAGNDLPVDWLLDCITGLPGVTEVPGFSKRVHGLFTYAASRIGVSGIPHPAWSKPAADSGVVSLVKPAVVKPVVRPNLLMAPATQTHMRRLGVRSWAHRWWNWLMGNPIDHLQPHVRDSILKIEPKSFFAAERNLLDWIHLCVVLTALAALQGGLAGLLIGGAPLLLLLWETRLYRLRNNGMTEKATGIEYADSFGPQLLFVALIALAGNLLIQALQNF